MIETQISAISPNNIMTLQIILIDLYYCKKKKKKKMGTELVICELNIATKLKVQENIIKNCQYYSIISCLSLIHI